MILKTAGIQVMANFAAGAGGFRRIAASGPFRLTEARLSSVLEKYAAMYAISHDPEDYLFTVARCLTADVPNENRDCFGEYELLRATASGVFTYETFGGVPLHQEHKAEDPRTAGGIVVDAFYDDRDQADRRVIGLVALDTVKRPATAARLRAGEVQGFSMGCQCEQTRCSACGNIARHAGQFCEHVRNKFAIPYRAGKGVFEWCEGVEYRELSEVANPADPKALSLEVIH